jgi:hypothetical protein
VVNRRFHLRIRPGNNPSRTCHGGREAGETAAGKQEIKLIVFLPIK